MIRNKLLSPNDKPGALRAIEFLVQKTSEILK